MEFQYCDGCGDITQTNHASGSELLCASCAGKGGASAKPAQKPTGLDLLSDPTQEIDGGTFAGSDVSGGDFDLFSNETVVSKKEPQKPKSSSKLKLVDSRESAPPAPDLENTMMGMTQPMGGTIYPKKEDERWRVDCLHCAGSLSVRPAAKRSKLRCPRCKGVMVLEASGEVTSVGSTVVQRRAPRPPVAPTPVENPPVPRAATRVAPPVAPVAPPVAPVAPPAPIAPPVAPVAPKIVEPMRPAASAPAMAASNTAPTIGTPPPFAPAGDTSLGRFEKSFLGDSSSGRSKSGGGATATAVAPPPIAPPPIAPSPIAQSPAAPPPLVPPLRPATAPIGGGGQEFAISSAEVGTEVEERAAALVGPGAYAGSGVPTVTRHSTRAAPTVATAGTFTSLLWITVAMAPSLCGLLLVHESTAAFGDSFLGEIGAQVSENAGKVLDWCGKLLGR